MISLINKILRKARTSLFLKRLRIRGIQLCGPLHMIGRPPSIIATGTVKLGSGVSFRTTETRTRLNALKGGEIDIGENTFINSGVTISSQKSVKIGPNCKIGDMSAIHDSNFHQIDQDSEVITKPITIGKNVWLGRNVMILPGVTIGDHSVIGAGSVVKSDIPACVIATGNPAQVQREILCSPDFVRI